MIRTSSKCGLNFKLASAKMFKWPKLFRKLTVQDLAPYNWGQPDCPKLQPGDHLYTVLVNDAVDYIAGLCGMDCSMATNKIHKWKVLSSDPKDGNLLAQRNSDRFMTAHLPWSDGNLVTVPGDLCHSKLLIRFYYKTNGYHV